eukprot:s298_g21.t1
MPASRLKCATAAIAFASPVQNLMPTYVHLRWKEFLMSIGLSAKQLWKVEKFWSISGERVPPLSRCEMVREYLQTEVGLNSEQLARTIADCPEVLEVFSVETLKEKVRFLEVEVGIDDDLPEIIAAYPKVFCRPILTTLRPALEFWLGTAKVSPEDFPQMLKKHAVQIWSRPQSLKPKLRFAKEVMGLSVEKVLACKTPFFRLSVAKTVAPRHFFAIQKKASGEALSRTCNVLWLCLACHTVVLELRENVQSFYAMITDYFCCAACLWFSEKLQVAGI